MGRRRWRRLPEGLEGWPREFYCALNSWDPQRASCDAPEEEWQRELPTTGDIIVYQVAADQWLQVQASPVLRCQLCGCPPLMALNLLGRPS